jgi:hypothetical protein
MRRKAFETIITETPDFLVGPWRQPHQMLNAQIYDSHASIHDDATAQKLGFQGGTIEGPTHFSQFAPLCASVWGQSWFGAGCISGALSQSLLRGRRGTSDVGEARARQQYAARRR